MPHLVQLAENTFCLTGATNVGIVRIGGDDVCLVDSGPDAEAGRRVLEVLDERGWRLKAILCTHFHADHTGANAYLQGRTGCPVLLPAGELAFARSRRLAPTLLAGGSAPSALFGPMFVPEPYDAGAVTAEALPDGFETVGLPGHSFDMAGYRTPDGVLFVADVLASERTLATYRVPFVLDVGAHLNTLEAVAGMEAVAFVPAHAQPCRDASGLARRNVEATLEVADMVWAGCEGGATAEQIVAGVVSSSMVPRTFEHLALVGSTVRSYLAYLEGLGRVRAGVRGGAVVWERT